MEMIDRDYQSKCIDAIFTEWQTVTATAAVLATGLGKTHIFAKVIERARPLRALVIAHRKELIEQAKARIYDATGLQSDIEMGWERADDTMFNKKPVVIATVQSLNSGKGKKRMHKWNPEEFGVIVIDECHHATAKTYRAIIDYFRQNKAARFLLVTATPDRGDEEALSQVCDSVAFTYDILDGVNDGWLVPITQQFCPVSSLDFSHVRTTAGDLNEGDLAKIMEAEENVQGVCHPALEVLYGLEPKTLSNMPVSQWTNYLSSVGKNPRRAIVFTVSVAQAEACCNILNRVIPGIAEWICGKTPKDDRAEILSRYQSGKTPVVVNCSVLTEGFDAPATEVIFMARPTKSRALYAQMVGRSTRPLPGLVDGVATAEGRKAVIAISPKPRCRIIDFCGNSGRHKLICALDVLGFKHSDEVIEAAIAKAKADGKPVTVLKQLSAAEADLEKKRREAAERLRLAQEARKRGIVAKADFHHVEVDPFGQKQFATFHKSKHIGPPATDKQKKVIGNAGINPKELTKKKAGWIISILAANNWRLPKQYEFLKQAS